MSGTPAATRLRDRLRSGPPVVGTFVKLPALESIDLVKSIGFDVAAVDGEHSQLDESAILALLRHGAALGLPMLVRTPTRDAGVINRMLEAGAAGIQLSTLRSRGDRDAMVSATRYAPDGTRSVSLAHPGADYSGIPLVQYLERSKAFPLLIGQIETATTDDPLPEILEGLDAAFIGTTDLSVDLGRPGKLDDERIRARVSEIAAAAARASAALGAWVATADALASLRGRGLRYVLVGSDVQLLRAGLAGVLAAARQALS
ncbi:MAG TPA: aldolase/citrate lyase family protein [Candidatus Limnocylindria bacterium]|nr:aldolase/citrate lyase family protein [Candidatus Limnocylindria bacterium]